MPKNLDQFFTRDIESDFLGELFLVNSVVSIIVIRVFLNLTGYPKLGGSGLHIAHMLWGGLLMLIALILLLSFLNRTVRYIAAVVGGLGFGTFIDELGKFTTADNNYFFKPTFALIYLLLIVLYFIFRWVSQYKQLSASEYLVNALELLKGAAIGDFSLAKRRLLKKYLNQASLSKTKTKQIMALVEDIQVSAPAQPNLYLRFKKHFVNGYKKILKTGWFSQAIAWLFIFRAVTALIEAGYFLFLDQEFSLEISKLGFFDWGAILSSTLINSFIIIGLLKLRGSQRQAFVWFKRSILVSIFIYQFFAFYHNQLIAVLGVLIDLLLLYGLQFVLSQNKEGRN